MHGTMHKFKVIVTQSSLRARRCLTPEHIILCRLVGLRVCIYLDVRSLHNRIVFLRRLEFIDVPWCDTLLCEMIIDSTCPFLLVIECAVIGARCLHRSVEVGIGLSIGRYVSNH